MSGLGDQLKSYLSSSKTSLLSGSSENDLSTTSSSRLSWFGRGGGGAGTDEDDAEVIDSANGWFAQAQGDPCLPSLSKKQRIIGFVGCILMGTFCFSMSSLYVPFLVVKARKFAMLYTLGSLFIIMSFSLLWGPVHHMKHLLSGPRLPFTIAYFGTLFATLYFAIWVKSTALTLIFAVIQILSLVWYIVSYIPGGQTGLKFFSKLFYAAASKTVQKTLPV